MYYSTDKLLENKTNDQIPDEVMENIYLVSLPPSDLGDESANPFGSYFRRSSRVWGDIDLIQQYVGCCTTEDVGIQVAQSLQNIVGNISKKEFHYFSEIKAGFDERFMFDIGQCINGVYSPSDELYMKIEELQQYFDNNDVTVLNKVLKKCDGWDGDDYDTIFNLFRDKYVLRWSEKEIMSGEKESNGRIFRLEESVIFPDAPLKIDVLLIDSNGKFIELTNYMAVGVVAEGCGFTPLNIDLDEDADPANLQIPIEQLYYSNWYYSPFKHVKRCFAFLNSLYKKGFGDKMIISNYVQMYNKILASTLNILYGTRSELDVMKLILEKHPLSEPLKKKLNDRLDMMISPISNVLELDDSDVEEFADLIDKVIREKRKNYKAEMIDDMMKMMKIIINYHTIEYLDRMDLNPPPSLMLPNQMTYDPDILRTKDSNPENPMKKLKGGFFKSLALKAFRKFANKYRKKYCNGKSRPLYPGELHFKCHNFTGPGTEIWRKNVRDMAPFNAIDACSKQHDLDYMEAVEQPDDVRKEMIRQADKDVIECYNRYPKENGYRVAKMGINSKMKLEQVLPIVARSLFGKISASGYANLNEKEILDYLQGL